jgi:hypothetical protein
MLVRMERLIEASDPGSDRLAREQIIEIHQAHRNGEPWKQIAEHHGTNTKNVSRIVQGYRWRSLHPSVRPDLYVEGGGSSDNQTPVEIINSALAEIERLVGEVRATLSGI